MRKKIHCAMLLVSLLAGLQSCDKTPQNGELDGFWLLVESGKPEARPRKADKVTWAVQLDLISVRSPEELGPGTKEAVFRFNHKGGQLTLTEGFAHYRDHDDRMEAVTEGLRNAGIGALPETYRVDRLDGERMVLVSATDSLVFRKY